MNFRKDINGLRAIAVIAVVLFHFRITGFTGGFSGVDIFFVISGYLMTGIIFSKIDQSRFSLIDFYLHRARRIIPALAVLCLFLMVFGFFTFLTHEYRETMRNVKSAIQFISNISFNDNDFNYFDSPAQENWLLHTWSLSVEWQFYLLYPLCILLLRRFLSRTITKISIIALAVISLGYSIIFTPIDPSSAFYLLPTRAWEMCAGGIIFLFPLSLNHKVKQFLSYLGLLIILSGIFLLTDKLLWPSYWAIIPIIGTMLVIYANYDNLITNNAIFQWLGKISYSVYLWHWPIVVLLLTAGLLTHPYYVVGGIILSLILGNLSYFFIEKRIKLKYNRLIECCRYLLIIALITGLAAILGSLVKDPAVRNNAFFSKNLREIITLADLRSPYSNCLQTNDLKTFPECKVGTGKPSIIVFGDSHANVTFSALLEANNKGASILWAYMGCPILDNVKFTIGRREGCRNLIKEKLALLESDYPNVPVLMVNRLFNTLGSDQVAPQVYFTKPTTKPDEQLYQEFKESYLRTICTISKKHPVYILKPIPEPGFNVPKKLVRELFFGQPITTQSTSLVDYYKLNKFVLGIMNEAHQQCGAILLDPVPYLCPNGHCFSSKDHKPMYFDDNHLTEYGNKQLVPLFKQIFNKE